MTDLILGTIYIILVGAAIYTSPLAVGLLGVTILIEVSRGA